MAKTWKNYIDEHNKNASVWENLRSSFKQFPETLIADIDAINLNDAGLKTLDYCVMKGCSNKGGKNYYKHLASVHKARKTEQTVKPVETVKPVKTMCDKKEDKKENENSGLCSVVYCTHCKLLETRLRKYAVYIRCKYKNSDHAPWCDLLARHGAAPADYSKIMAILEDATLY